jgi:hypothetical protein
MGTGSALSPDRSCRRQSAGNRVSAEPELQGRIVHQEGQLLFEIDPRPHQRLIHSQRTGISRATKTVMSERIIELLHQNLQEVFGEGDAARRRAAIDQFYTADCVLYVPPGVFIGRDALDKFAGDPSRDPPAFCLHASWRSPSSSRRWNSRPGVRGRKAKLPITPGWTSSLSATEGLLRYTFSSIQNSRSSARYEP